MDKKFNTVQDKGENFRGKDGKLYLERCYVCQPEYGKENYGPAVASGTCAWCGWSEKGKKKIKKEKVDEDKIVTTEGKEIDRKLIAKIAISYDDGTVQYLEGEDARNWGRKVNGAVAHGSKLPEFPWKYKKEKKK